MRVLEQVMTLCQRNTERMSEAESQGLWFKVLDALVVPLKRINHSSAGAQTSPETSLPRESTRRQRLFQDRYVAWFTYLSPLTT